MKLSKNRLNKIKRNKNHSKRKKVFRKKKHSYKNTQKKNRKQHNLKNKTLKIYVGGERNKKQGYTRIRETDNNSTTRTSSNKSTTQTNDTTISPLHNTSTTTPTTIQTNDTTNRMNNVNNTNYDGPIPKYAISTLTSYSETEKNTPQPEKNLTDKQITEIFNTLKENDKDETISLTQLYKFITGRHNPDHAKLVSSVIGLDPNKPLTISDIKTGIDATSDDQLRNKSKNIQIISSLLKSFRGFKQKEGNNSDEIESNQTNITLNKFKQFINCGQHRDKTKNIFDCNMITIPKNNKDSSTNNTNVNTEQSKTNGTNETNDQAGTIGTTRTNESDDQSGTNRTTGTNESDDKSGNTRTNEKSKQSNNIELSINEKEFDGKSKRVDVSIFIPNDGEVIVRNYAKQSTEELLANLQ